MPVGTTGQIVQMGVGSLYTEHFAAINLAVSKVNFMGEFTNAVFNL